ncbi:MAG TPA: hypothetical protein PKY88_01940 [Anaerohalosphaeraceae bacterium]|nr:hypothetical protein [Anaerohalosphaeraceae bacterium]
MRQRSYKQAAKADGGLVAVLLALTAFGAGFLAYWFVDRRFVRQDVPQAFRYSMEELTAIEPSLLVYRQSRPPIETGLQTAVALDVDSDGSIWAAGDQKILCFSGDGRIEREIALPSKPTALKAADGVLYAALTDRIEIYSLAGERVSAWAPVRTALFTSIAVGPQDVFAADALNKVIHRFDKQGNPRGLLGAKDLQRGIDGFVVPSPYFDVLIGRDGLLRATNPGRQRVEAYTFDGHLEWHWGIPSVKLEGFSGCCNPIALAQLPDGTFVTGEKGLVRVKVHDDQGRLLGVAAGPQQLGWKGPIRVCEKPEECSSRGLDVAADGQGRIYVLEQVRNTILIFEKNQ